MIELTVDTLTEIASRVDHELEDIASTDLAWRTRGGKASAAALKKQKRAINRIVGESADSFLTRFRQAAWQDLCVEGGHLNGIRKRWLNPTKPEVIRSIAALLAGMGISGNLVPVLVVPLLVIILHLGANAFCAMPIGRRGDK